MPVACRSVPETYHHTARGARQRPGNPDGDRIGNLSPETSLAPPRGAQNELGCYVLSAVSGNARRPHLPIVFVTGYADVGALAHAGDAGVIQKPFEDHELASKLRAVLESLSA